MRTEIKELLATANFGDKVTVKGWVKAFRQNRFIQINDGSTINNVQAVIDFENTEEELLKRINTAAAVSVTGILEESQGKGQKFDLIVEAIEILGDVDPDEVSKTVMQPKKHSLEFLREQAHLRFRTNLFGAIFRIRHATSFAIHKYFNDRGYYHIATPIITGSDAEGAGEMFRVSNLDPKNPPLTEDGAVDWSEDFFGKETNLTVSGQLEAELAAMALGKVYTFGPTFRAENSNTARHLAEFWMVEPEVAFADLEDIASLAEDMLKYVFKAVLDERRDDMEFFAQRIEKTAISRLEEFVEKDFAQVDYTDAITILENCGKKFEFPVEWGVDLQSEHERYLAEEHFKAPVVIKNYPRDIKAFYMRQNEDGKTVAAMDVVAPGIGEIIGGSQREERLDVLDARLEEIGLHKEDYSWYRDLRKYGTVPHSGFGLGFERLVAYVTGMGNVRDVIAFPRAKGNANY